MCGCEHVWRVCVWMKKTKVLLLQERESDAGHRAEISRCGYTSNFEPTELRRKEKKRKKERKDPKTDRHTHTHTEREREEMYG